MLGRNMDAKRDDVKPDRLTILTCSPSMIATKRHHRRAAGGWHSDQYDNAYIFAARVESISSFGDLVRLLRSLEAAPRSLLVRDLPRDGVDMSAMRRKIDTMAPQSIGLRALCIDIEGITFEDAGVVDLEPGSRASLEAAVRAIADKVLPSSCRGCELAYQWSSSAGVKGWSEVRLHLWLWLDRPVFRGSLKRWAREVEGVDASLYDSVRIHYTGAPVFVDHVGRSLPDLLGRDARGSLRSGVLGGPTPVAPIAWVSRDVFELDEVERTRRANEERRRLEAASREQLADPVTRAQHEAKARSILRAIANDLRTLPKADRHGYVRGRIRRAFGVRHIVPIAEIVEAIYGAAVAGLERAGRSTATATGEVDRLVDELVKDPSRAPSLPIDIAAGSSRLDSVAADARVEVGYLTPRVERARVEPPAGPAWASPAEGWRDDIASRPISLEAARAWLDQTCKISMEIETLDGGLRVAIAAPAGSGKSYAAKRRCLIEPTADGDERAQLIVPTLDLAYEAADDLRRMAGAAEVHPRWHVAVATTRRGPRRNGDAVEPATCHFHEQVSEAARLTPNGGAAYCKRCDLHPDNIGSRLDACLFFRMRRSEATADVVVKTHALAVLEAQSADDDDLDELAAIVLDEDPSGAMTHTGALDAGAISRLVQSGDLELDDTSRGVLARLLDETAVSDRVYRADELVDLLPPAAWSVANSYLDGAATLAAALEIADETARGDALRSGVPWRSIAGLADAVASAWGAVSIRRGALQVAHTLALDLDRARTVVHLDATTSEARARALLGRDAVVKRVNVEWPSAARVVWIPAEAGARSRLHADGSRRVPLIWAATMARYALATAALVVTSKRNRDGERWTGALLEGLEARGVAVEHHRGAAGRGVNRYQDRASVVVDPWHVPRHAVEQVAYSWARLAGDDWTIEATRERWRVEARAQLLGAEVLQEIARIRPLAATAEAPKTIVILDGRDPRSLGLPLSEVVDPDRLVFDELGATTGVHTAPSIVRAAVDSLGGVYAPTVDARGGLKTLIVNSFAGISVARQRYISDVLPEYLQNDIKTTACAADVLTDWAANHGGWSDLASIGRLQLSMVELDTPGGAVPVLHTRPIHRRDLDHWARLARASRYRIAGHREWIEPEGVAQPLRVAICRLEYRDGATTQAIVDELSRAMSASTSTVRRHIDRLRSDLDESFDAALRRVIREVYAELSRLVPSPAGELRDQAIDELQWRLDRLAEAAPAVRWLVVAASSKASSPPARGIPAREVVQCP